MHEELWQKLIGLDQQKTAMRAKCQYFSSPKNYVIKLSNQEYTVYLSEKEIFSGSPPVPAEFLEQVCILVYLINAKDIPLSNKLVKAESLPSGAFFFRGPHGLPTDELVDKFGQQPERLCQIGEKIGARRCEFGDASIELNILPRTPITIVMWGSDDEFPARASILFDQTVSEHLPLDALQSAVNIAVKMLIDNL